MKTDVLIFSDVHLGSKDCHPDKLLKVLKNIKANKIIIAGDLFDHHNLHRLKKEHWKVLSKLRKLSKRCKIIYLIGNHCFLKAEFMSILLGFKCENDYVLEYNKNKILVVHGDVFDIYFTKYKWITNIIVKCYYFIRKYTPYADDFFRIFKNKTNDFVEKSSDVKKNAIKYIKLNGYDKIICGHTHIPEISDNYINTGSFCEEKCSYITINKKGKIDLDFC
jgi:UDP-2,3-diacylglucosamine pyrophosphatase LpxH